MVAKCLREFDWDRSYHQVESLRGIIKQLVFGVPHFTFQMVEKMSADLLTLSNIGIFVRDIERKVLRLMAHVLFSQASTASLHRLVDGLTAENSVEASKRKLGSEK